MGERGQVQAESGIVVEHKTTSYRGDHSAEVSYFHAVRPGETVLELVQRLRLEAPDHICLYQMDPREEAHEDADARP